MLPQFSSIILSIGSHGLGLVARFVAKNVHLLFYVGFSSVDPPQSPD
jgi:hypothetical protein